MDDAPKKIPTEVLFQTVLRSIEEVTLRRLARELEVSYPFPWKFERERYENNYLVQQFSEQMVQDAIIAELEMSRIDVLAIDAGMKRARGRILARGREQGINASNLVNFRGGGIVAGFSDLYGTLAPSGRGLFIEVKAPAWIDPDNRQRIIREAGTPTLEQLTFLDSKHSRGAIAMVAWSVVDVMRHLGGLADENLAALNRRR